MTAGKLIELLSKIPSGATVYIADNVGLTDDDDLDLETVTESCDDLEIVGYVVVDTSRKRVN